MTSGRDNARDQFERGNGYSYGSRNNAMAHR
jgi:hypothetical protein